MKRILLIEDNAELRDNTSEILSLAGYDVTAAENGKIGVTIAQKEKPDLIVCDIMMPELDGYGVLHILGNNPDTSAIPFIFLTAKTEKADIRKGMNLGADDYLIKPFEQTELLNAIETRLRKNQLRSNDYANTSDGLDRFIFDAQKTLNLEDLGKDKKMKLYKRKSILFSEGDAPQFIFFVNSGSIKSSKEHAEGKELITNLYKAGDFFGFESLLENISYQETGMAMEDSEVVLIPKNDFLLLLSSNEHVTASFIAMLCKKVSAKELQLLNLAYNSVRQRTAEALLRVSSQANLPTGEVALMSISRDDLANIAGTASESVTRILSDFKEEGLIEIESGKIRIVQRAKLEKMIRWNVVR
ncbi:response regulator [soil metagenome]